MPGIGIGQQHGVWEMLAQHVGIADRNHIVEDAIYDQTWLHDFAELGKALASVCFPGTKGLDLSDRDVCAGQGFVVLLSLGEPSYEGLSSRLTRFAWREEELYQFFHSRHVRIFRNLSEFRFLHMHNVLSSLWSGADKQHLVNKRGTFQRDLLRDHSTEGVAEDLQTFQAKCIDECEGVRCHARHAFGNLAGRTAKTRTLKKNDFTSYSKRIGDGGIPIVQSPGEVL